MRIQSYLRESARDLLVPAAGQVPGLDALRTAAVLMVILNHYGMMFIKQAMPQLDWFNNLPPVSFGWTGVDLFFVLSGFLIGRQLWREFQRTDRIDFPRFILRRGMRIWPLYFAFVVMSPITSRLHRFPWADVTFLSNYRYGYVAGGWSLSTEEQFYIVAPLAIIALARVLRLRGWLAALPVIAIAVQASRYFTGASLLATGLSRSDVKTRMYEAFHLHCEGLLVGLFIALVSVLRPDLVLAKAVTNVKRVWAGAALAMVVGLALRTVSNIVFPFLGLALFYGGIAVVLLSDRDEVIKVVKWRPFYTFSRLSYGMYLNHVLVLWFVMPAFVALVRAATHNDMVALVTGLLATVAVSTVTSSVTYTVIERPFLLLRERLLAHGERPGVAVPANVSLPFPARGAVNQTATES